MLAAANPPSNQRQAIQAALLSLPRDAPLHDTLEHPSVVKALERHEIYDADALLCESQFHTWGSTGLTAALVVGVLGSLLLAPDQAVPHDDKAVVGLLQALAVAVVLAATGWLHWRRPQRAWLTSRANAEGMRSEVFRQIVEAPCPRTADTKTLASQKFDLIMIAHIGDQHRFYRSACERHRHPPQPIMALRWLGYGFGVVAVAIAIAGLPEGLTILLGHLSVGSPDWLLRIETSIRAREAGLDAYAWQHVTGTLAGSLIGFASGWSLLHQNERNYSLYTENTDSLGQLIESEAEKAKLAAIHGSLEETSSFLAQAHRIMEAEHAVWMKVHQVVER